MILICLISFRSASQGRFFRQLIKYVTRLRKDCSDLTYLKALTLDRNRQTLRKSFSPANCPSINNMPRTVLLGTFEEVNAIP